MKLLNFNWLDLEMTDRATIVINGLLRKLDRMESGKRLQDEFNGRRKLNGCAAACWLCLVVIVFFVWFNCIQVNTTVGGETK
ncbi:hypothetical protein Scep_021292 [Stephania cephalantha]|uniref:Uncharacterized protein n=1 Tax=Stephania cephalantha TaxID=152367 RepID=A0AAP0F892_9MAGN